MYKIAVNDPHFLPHCGCHVEIGFNRGELIALVGENGAGKTTLAQRFHKEHFSETSLVEQRALDYFYDRALSQIKKIFLETKKGEIDVPFFTDCWKAFRLDQKEERFQSSLSGGEGQALKLCLGLAVARDIYVLDEPSQFLDNHSKNVLKEVIQRLLLNNKAVLIIEHDLDWIDLQMTVHELVVKNQLLQNEKSWKT